MIHMNSGLMRLKNFSPNIYKVCPYVHMDTWTLIIYIGTIDIINIMITEEVLRRNIRIKGRILGKF